MKFIREESGQVIAVFAVILPVFAMLAFCIVDIQWMTKQAANLDYIANELARCEALHETTPGAPLPCDSSSGGNTPRQYALQLAQSLRVGPDGLTVSAPDCNQEKGICTVELAYLYKPIGVWFPALTIRKTVTASFPPLTF